MRRHAKLVAAVSAFALVLAACGNDDDEPVEAGGDVANPNGDAAVGAEPAEVQFVTAAAVILPKEEVATYAVPTALGFFEDENLTVDVATADGSTAALQAVASGSADITAADLGSVFAAAEQGVPVTGVGGLVINWPWRIAVPPDGGIDACEDLEGTSIGIISLASGSNPFARQFVEACGLDPDADVELVPVGLGPQAAAALEGGEVQSLALFTQAYANLEIGGLEFEFLPNPDVFEDIVSLTWAVSNDFLAENPDVIQRFLRAAYKGLLFANADPTEAMRISYDVLPDLLGEETAEERLEDDAFSLTTWLETTALEGPVEDWQEFGHLEPEQLEASLEFAQIGGIVEGDLEVADAFDDGLLEAGNDFDRDEVLGLVP